MKCLNWKVLGAVAAGGVVLWAVAPGVAVAALPLLVLAACPLSMLVMMRAMGMGANGNCATERSTAEAEELTVLRAEVAALRAEREVR